jgi:hypothetical protein
LYPRIRWSINLSLACHLAVTKRPYHIAVHHENDTCRLWLSRSTLRRARRFGPHALLAVCFSIPTLVSADAEQGMAERLAALRSEVESLSAQLSEQAQDRQDRIRSLARQKAELEVELQRERTRLQKVRLSLSERKKQIAEELAQGAELLPLFERQLAEVRSHVSKALPFRTSERLAELDKLQDQQRSGLVSPERALMRLWSFLEDEFRMTRESGLFRQTVSLDGVEQLADVIRVGTVALYYRTGDDRVGFARREGEGWAYAEVKSKEERRMVLDLFESFRKQIRVGYFELPNALSSKVEP